jgi:signal transduction histidine kinase
MEHLLLIRRRIQGHLLAIVFLQNIILVGSYWYILAHYHVAPNLLAGVMVAVGLVLSLIITAISSAYVMTPIRAVTQAILHVSPGKQTDAPEIENLKLGRELLTNLTARIYMLASAAAQKGADSGTAATSLQSDFVANALPLPLFVLDATETIQFVNQAAADYIGGKAEELKGKNIYMVLDMLFPSEQTFDSWLTNAKVHRVTASNSWERVRMSVNDAHPERYFDLAAFYNKGNLKKIETILVLFDHTKMYEQDDQAVSFIALSVHELRTPLTLLRGYIEVFDEELNGKIEPELADFMQKMKATSQQLTVFVNNILNVARIDDDQFEMKLQSEDWATVLRESVDAISLRAQVRGITIETSVAADLPPVGIDRLSIQEVINNLVDNAIKYSGSSDKIVITSNLTSEGLIETDIQDFGVGIETSVMSNLFSKFYRDHRNRAQIGGTGLGLFLCKAVVGGHGGNIWVRSKIGEGSTFGFTILPYDQVADRDSAQNNQEIVRGAHGWIKNHSLYRR